MTDKFSALYSLLVLVWGVDISPFACNLLDGVTVLPFFRNQYTLNTDNNRDG